VGPTSVAPEVAQRLTSEERKTLLIDAAERVFVSRGYTQAGLAEVATLAGVSKTLLYHYFPDGRPRLYREVLDRLLDELVATLHAATAGPTPPGARLDGLIAALVTYFADRPDAYRLMVLEPWGSGEPEVVGQAMAVRNQLAGEVNELLVASGSGSGADTPTVTVVAGGAAVVGAVLQVCELAQADQLTTEQAVEIAQRFVRGGLASLGLLHAAGTG
jgi:AcrR family transcriptional regulator